MDKENMCLYDSRYSLTLLKTMKLKKRREEQFQNLKWTWSASWKDTKRIQSFKSCQKSTKIKWKIGHILPQIPDYHLLIQLIETCGPVCHVMGCEGEPEPTWNMNFKERIACWFTIVINASNPKWHDSM